MDILQQMSRLSVMSQTTSHSTNTAKSLHSRKLSYEEVKTPNTVDYLVALCAGNNASFRLERKRMLAYFEGIPDTANTISSENWANAVGGEIAGERNVQPSFRTPWAKPNSGITFRYRYHGAAPSTSCSTNCTTFDHHEYKPSIASNRSSTTTLNSPPISIIRDTPAGKTLHVLEPRYHVHLRRSSFPAAKLPEVLKACEKRTPLDLAGACAEYERARTTRELVENSFQEQLNEDAEDEDEERDNGDNGYREDNCQKEEQSEAELPLIISPNNGKILLDSDAKEKAHTWVDVGTTAAAARAQEGAISSYFQSVREIADIRSYLKENPSIYSSLPKEAKLEARRTESKKSYRQPNVEDEPGEETVHFKQNYSVSFSITKAAQFQAGHAEIRKSHHGACFRGFRKEESAHFKPMRDTYTRSSQSQTDPFESKMSLQRYNSHTKQVRFVAGPRQRSYQRPPFEDIAEEDISHFKNYPNTFAGLKDPTEHTLSPEKRRVERLPQYFVHTPWEMDPRPATGHCKEFIQQRDYNPLAFRHTIDPAEVAKNVAIRQALILERHRSQPVPPLVLPKRGPPRHTRKYISKANVRPVFRAGPTPRPVNVTQASANRSMYFIR
jgi:hypothetical protein